VTLSPGLPTLLETAAVDLSLAFGDERHGAAIADGRRRLLLTDDGGSNWREVWADLFQPAVSGTPSITLRPPTLTSVNYVGASDIWVTGVTNTDDVRNRPFIAHSRDEGLSWVVSRPSDLLSIEKINFVSASHGWLIGGPQGRSGSLFVTTDGGQTWKQTWPDVP
jgi:photosystem II stability/assembly factor-like uncharacterized protein